MDLWLDFETRSTVNLKTAGLHVYAPKAKIMLCAWAVDTGPVRVEEKLTPQFWDAFCKADRIIAHSAEFDRTVLHAQHPEMDIRFDRWYCTVAQARRHGLPGGLDKLCDVLKVPTDQAKMKDSRPLLMLFCKPRPDGTWADKSTHPAEWARFVQYGGLDVEAMREVHRRCPKWNDEYEHPVWLADQRINARGFAVDTQFAEAAVAALKGVAEATDEAVSDATSGAVRSGRQVEALLAHILEAHGVDLPDMQSATIERRLADPDLPGAVRELLALRQQSAKTSTSKYATLIRRTGADGRMRGTLTYSGAMRTQRWAGQGFQPHNLPRPAIGKLRGQALKDEIRLGIAAVKAGAYDLVGRYPLPEVLASAVRGCVVPAPGKKLTIGDYSNVEGRALAWLAGEQWKLDAFQAYDDGDGPDLYKVAYSRAFGVPVEDVDDGAERQLGKVMELMLGYGGGVNAFITGCATYKVDIATILAAWPLVPEDVREECAGMWDWAVREKRTLGLDREVFMTCDALKRLWRRKHPRTAQFWGDLEAGFKHVAGALGRQGATVGTLTIDKVGAWVRIRLPSGRYLSYPGAQVKDDKLSYLGVNQYTRTWGRIGTYGGKLAENVTQAVCRDLLAESLLNAEEWHLPVVLHVHDELVVENEEDQQDNLADAMRAIDWADGLPLAVATETMDRYHKS